MARRTLACRWRIPINRKERKGRKETQVFVFFAFFAVKPTPNCPPETGVSLVVRLPTLPSMTSPLRLLCLLILAVPALRALDRPEVTFKVFQFPADKIPRIDGDISDWDIVGDDYAIKMDQFVDDGKPNRVRDPKNLDVKVRVGWVKGLN